MFLSSDTCIMDISDCSDMFGQDCRRAVPGKTRRPVRRGGFEEIGKGKLVRHHQRKRWKTDRQCSKLIESDFYSTIPLNMAFSIKQLLLFIAAVSIAIFVSTLFSPLFALLLTVGLACALTFLFPASLRRPFVYGGIAGIVTFLILTDVVLHVAYINVPREPLISRLAGPWNGQMQPPQVQRDMAEQIRPYAVTLGFVFGASALLIIWRPLAAMLNKSPQLNEVRCDSCGRMNAKSTKICPKCLNRLESKTDDSPVNAE